mmetsp:Transcript_30873/g.73528  ORF Transcript_30873/g.73528 Transcript_30873/m.73528 type:complete len:336 (+) Transcript_30873:492-1499(+)
MRSASSRQRYLQQSRFIRFLCRRSLRRPGVATMMWQPSRRTSVCVLTSTPPIASSVRTSGKPASRRTSQYPSMTWLVCLASSRDGQMTIPTGPSPLASGIRCSSWMASITSGSENTSVLPEPVKAMPIMSRPDRTTGRPCTWIGVGLVMFFDFRCSMTGCGKRISLNDVTGGGMSSPSTRIAHFFLTASCSLAFSFRTPHGGRQPVSIELSYSTPFASSFTLFSAVFMVMCLRMSCSSSSCFSGSAFSGMVARVLALAMRRLCFTFSPSCWSAPFSSNSFEPLPPILPSRVSRASASICRLLCTGMYSSSSSPSLSLSGRTSSSRSSSSRRYRFC